jgi:Methyltransferase domain
MLFKHIQADLEVTDSEFDKIYPKKIKAVSEIHFTPVSIAKMAAAYLAENSGTKVLDVGAGAGKFCMIGAACTKGYFYGVEQRKNLCSMAKRISNHYHLDNVAFINENIINIEFKAFDAFYFFNAFYENVSLLGAIDTKIALDKQLYYDYSYYVRDQLAEMPIGTKLVTFHSFLKEIPDNYQVQFTSFDEKLKFWKKID